MTGKEFKGLEICDWVRIENDDNLYEVLDKDRMGRVKMRMVKNGEFKGNPFWMDYRDVELN